MNLKMLSETGILFPTSVVAALRGLMLSDLFVLKCRDTILSESHRLQEINHGIDVKQERGRFDLAGANFRAVTEKGTFRFVKVDWPPRHSIDLIKDVA